MKSVLNIHWKDWCWSWSSNTLATWCEELTHLKIPWCWERLKAGGEGDDRGWDGWMESPTQRTWVWVNSRIWWWTGRPGMLLSMGLQRARHDWVTEQQYIFLTTKPEAETNRTERKIDNSKLEKIPVVRAPCFHCQGHRFNPWPLKLCGVANKQTKIKTIVGHCNFQ